MIWKNQEAEKNIPLVLAHNIEASLEIKEKRENAQRDVCDAKIRE